LSREINTLAKESPGSRPRFLEPRQHKRCQKRTAFDGSKRDEAFSIGQSFRHPVDLALDARKVVDIIEEAVLFSLVLQNGVS